MSRSPEIERLKSQLDFAASLGPETAIMTTQETVRAVLAEVDPVYVTADGSHVTGERAVDLYDDEKARSERAIGEREEQRQRAEAAEARVKELEDQLEGTMHAGGYKYFTEQLRNVQKSAHNANYVAEQERAKAEKLEARAEQQQEALQAAAQVFEWLDNVEWPQSECDAFHGNAGSCPIDYSQAQQAVNAALNHDQETNT